MMPSYSRRRRISTLKVISTTCQVCGFFQPFLLLDAVTANQQRREAGREREAKLVLLRQHANCEPHSLASAAPTAPMLTHAVTRVVHITPPAFPDYPPRQGRGVRGPAACPPGPDLFAFSRRRFKVSFSWNSSVFLRAAPVRQEEQRRRARSPDSSYLTLSVTSVLNLYLNRSQIQVTGVFLPSRETVTLRADRNLYCG